MIGARIRLPALCVFAAGVASCQSVNAPAEPVQVDLIIAGGKVFDGTFAEGRVQDIAIEDGRIVFVGSDAAASHISSSTLDASGLVVAPGFIDPHTHAGEDLASDEAVKRANLAFAFQGVTTVIVGNDGFGTPNIAEMAAQARAAGIGTNVAYLAGFGPIREAALGKTNQAPDKTQLDQMLSLTRGAMCEGAWGFSTGLYYVPQNYAATDEVVALATVAGEFGGYYDTHMRDESTYNITVTGAVAETLEIGRRADLPVHIAHIKALGPAVWGHSAKIIELVEAAQANGQRVTADQYPWDASGTRISNALVPRWALEGGLAALRERLADPAERDRIAAGIAKGLDRRGGADRLLITAPLGAADVEVGQTLADIAEVRGVSAVEAAIAILERGDARVASFNMNAADIVAFAGRDWVVTGSDGSSGHPRKYASFPKAYRDLVVNGEMSLARFIQRSSAQTAEIVGLVDRGYLRPGYAADIVIFDPASFAPRATYEHPRELSAGVRHLLVNGQPVIAEGEYTGILPGTPLLKKADCSAN